MADGLRLLGELHRRRNLRPVEETVAALLTATRAHAAFILRPSGERSLANVLRIAELARGWEASGGISFRGFVEQLDDDDDSDASEAPVVEEGSEGVRIMTVHRAKGLEFPVVILADIGANISAQNPSRYIDSERGLCAVRLAGWSPWDLLDHEEEELARDRAEGVRVAYVAATRARDLLVVPAVGDDPFASNWESAAGGWLEPVQRAVYPDAGRRRAPEPAPACPPFGEDSVAARPDRDAPGRDNVKPGLHVFGDEGEGRYPVVWWDPRALTLDVQPQFGIRRQDLIEDPGPDVLEADRRSYQDWQRARAAALERGAQPTFAVQTVTEWARRAAEVAGAPEPEVTVIDAASGVARPTGPRFGTLVHAILATVALDAGRDAIAEVAALQARILGAPDDEARSGDGPGRGRPRPPAPRPRPRGLGPRPLPPRDTDHRGRARRLDPRGRARSRLRGGRRLDGGRLQDPGRAVGPARPIPPPGRRVRLRGGPRHRPPGDRGAAAPLVGGPGYLGRVSDASRPGRGRAGADLVPPLREGDGSQNEPAFGG